MAKPKFHIYREDDVSSGIHKRRRLYIRYPAGQVENDLTAIVGKLRSFRRRKVKMLFLFFVTDDRDYEAMNPHSRALWCADGHYFPDWGEDKTIDGIRFARNPHYSVIRERCQE